VSAAAVFVATITGATTFTFVNWPPGAVAPEPTVIARQDNAGHTISFAGITWLPVGTSPVFQVGANQTNVTTFFSTDNGVTVYGQGGSLSGGGGGRGGNPLWVAARNIANDGTTGAGAAGTNVLGVNGGFAGRGGRANGSATGGGVNGIASTPASGLPRAFPEVAYMAIQTPTGTTWIGGGASGGAGDGDGTNAGGGGGRGGNPLWVAARNIANNGAMQAAGGAGGNSTGGNAGGGGGGQGGPIIYIYSTYAGSGVVLSLGGAGGTGTGTGTGGASGGPGWIAPLAN
jgi:hypothetical protein